MTVYKNFTFDKPKGKLCPDLCPDCQNELERRGKKNYCNICRQSIPVCGKEK